MRFTTSIKENRLFRKLYNSKINFVTPYFVVYCRPNRLSQNQLGLTVGAKIGCAAVRNRIKRRLREVYRLAEFNLRNSYDIVIVARGKAQYAPFSVMQNSFSLAAKKLGIYKESLL